MRKRRVKSYHARVEIRLKPGHLDPEGETTKKSLVDLKYGVKRVDVVKVYELDFDAASIEEAKKQMDEMCRKLLANPIKDDYKFEIRETK